MAVSRVAVVGAAANVAGFTVSSMPSHAAGDRLLMVLAGKYDDTTIPAAPSGWTLVGSGTGGTGTPGADVGKAFLAVYAIDATGTVSAPTITWGATAPNSATYFIVSYRPTSGKSWRDAITASAAWLEFTEDTATANPMEGTFAALAGQPTAGDALFAFGATPTDTGTTVGSSTTLSATGLSGGTQTFTDYVESAAGLDSAQVGGDWVGFTGTATSGVTASFTVGSSNNSSGPLAVVALRETASEDLTVAATTPQPALAVVLQAEGLLTVAATLPHPTLAVALEAAEPALSVAATLPQPVLAVALDASGEVDLSVAATIPQPTLAVALDAPPVDADLSVAATIPQPALAVSLDVTPLSDTLTVAATIPQPVLAVSLAVEVVYGTDTSNRDDGIDLDGTAEVFWEPDVVAVPAGVSLGERRIVAHVITTVPGPANAFTPAVRSEQSVPALRDRILIGDQDFTFFRDTPTPTPDFRLIDPLLYGSGTLTLPQVNPQFEQVGAGALAQIQPFARVVVQRVDSDDEVVETDYKGFISRIDTSGPQLVLHLGGQASGRLSAMYVTPPVYRRKQEVEHILVDILRDGRVRAKKHDGLSGVSLIRRGGSDGLTIFNETLAVWAGATDSPITFTPNVNGAYRKTVKDTETIHATAYIDSNLISQSLSRDFMSEFTRVYARGRTAAGELVANIKTPGLTQGEAPDFPHATLLQLGMDDADTTSGAGITALQQQLAIHDFLDTEDTEPGEFDDATAEAVERLQDDRGFLTAAIGAGQVGKVNAALWDTLWDLDDIGYSLDEAREYPTVQDSATRKWNRTANGSKAEENPDYDPYLIPVDLTIDVGGPFPHRRIKRFARSKLAPDEGVWLGTLDFESGLIIGDHTPGDPFTTADVMSARDLRPNMNVKLPWFMGGIVVTISGLDISESGTRVQAMVSTLPETTMETWAAIERMREAQSNPGNTWSGHVRSSQVRNDEAVEWDTSSGWIANDVALTSGWNEVKVPAGQSGIVQRIRVQLEDAAEFACLLTQKPTSLGALASRVPTPLADPRPANRPWWERETIDTWLEGRGVLDAWGTWDQPCGYSPSLKTDDQGATAQAMTGLFKEIAGFNYSTGSEPVLYLYVWVGSANVLLPGRILRNQRTSDF